MSIILLSLALLSAHLHPGGWSVFSPHADSKEQIRVIIEEVEQSSNLINNKLDVAKIRVRAAALLWKIDPETGRQRFELLWRWIETTILQPGEAEQARIEVLRALIQLDRQLAESWMSPLADVSAARKPNSLLASLAGADSPRLKLAQMLIDDDPALAAQMLGEVFREGYNYRSHATLRSLAEKNQPLADRVVIQLLDRLSTQHDELALIGAQHLFEYFYPRRPELVTLPGGTDPTPGTNPTRDLTARQRFFEVASSILTRSVESPGIRPDNSERRLVETNRALLAIELNALASGQPGIDPDLAKRLGDLARRYRPSLPAELAGIPGAIEKSLLTSRSTAATINSHDADSAGGPAPAPELFQAQLERARYTATMRGMISRRNLAEALSGILTIDDGLQRVILLGELGQALRLEKEPHFSTYVIGLLLKTSNELPHSPRKAEILFSMLQNEPSWKLLDGAIETLNGLSNGAERIISSNSFRHGLVNTIKLDKEVAFEKIKEINSVTFELMARLTLCEALLNPQPGN
ncbi:MAG: hypothetical protein ACK5RR_01905 [Acidobacteriota bacterium]